MKDNRIKWCKHHSSPGPLEDKCALGIDISKMVQRGTYGAFYKLPCHNQSDKDVVKCSCDKLEFFTDKEVADQEAEEEKWLEEAERRITIIVPLMQKLKESPGMTGIADCPVCKTGKINWSCSIRNRHLIMKCSTLECINFME